MDVLILAGYRKNCGEKALEKSNDILWIDQQIETTRNLGLNPIVILAGDHADDVIRSSKKLPEVELVFDTHGNEATLTTNLKAGLHLVSNTCFALALDVPAPEKSAWLTLRHSFQKTGFSTKMAFIQLEDEKGAPWHWGFPLFVTRLGRHLLLNGEGITSLTDPALSYFRCVFETPEDLVLQSPTI